MPETLDGTYEQSLRRIDKQKRDFACRLFQCLVVSKRPLRVEELAELFAIQPDVDTIPTFDARCRPENPEEFVLSACSTLVAVVNNRRHKIVQFSHFSVREYLTSDRIAISEHVSRFQVLLRPAHALLARACLSVLLQLDDHIVQNEIQDFPLTSYAAQYWVEHAQFDNVASEIQHGMGCLFDKGKPHFKAWRRVYNIDNQTRYSGADPPHSVPLYYAALCGFRHLVEHLVNAHPKDVNARGGRCTTPLHAAVNKGHLAVAMFLLEHGADIRSRDSQSRTSLHVASYHGYADVVSFLIDRGVDPNTETDNRETPLYLASKYGRQDAARLLLEHSADPNHQNAKGLTPLHAAWKGGHVGNIRLLLDHGADVKSPDNRGNSPLHVVLQESPYGNILVDLAPPSFSLPAFLEYRLDVVTLLLEHGADASYPDNDGETPLHIVLRRGLIDIVRLFLHHGADANIPDKRGTSPLHVVLQEDRRDDTDTLLFDYPDGPSSEEPNPAFLEHRSDIVMLLLDHGADANHPDNNGGTPLHIASQRGFIDIVRLLLHHGADVNRPDIFGITPLHDALKTSHDEIIRLLLDLPGNDSWTLLHAASQEGHDDIVGALLNHGVDANRPDNDGWTALHAASQEGHNDIVRLLLSHGADVNRSDDDGWNPLHAASQEGHDTVVRLLLDHGAAADHTDRDSWTPLHAASQQGHNDIVQLLLNHGAAPNHQDHRGWTPLHATSQEGHNDIVQLLLDHGAAPNHQDNRGWTPLHAASLEGHDNIVRLLLDHGAAPNHQDNRGRTPLHAAWKKSNGHHTSPYLLLRPDSGANCPGSGSSDAWSLLRRVSKRGNNNTVRLLLKRGADANQPDSDGLTPLHLALQAGTATASTSYYSVMAQR